MATDVTRKWYPILKKSTGKHIITPQNKDIKALSIIYELIANIIDANGKSVQKGSSKNRTIVLHINPG